LCLAKGIDPALPSVGDDHDMTVLLECIAQGLQHDRIIVHEENSQRPQGGEDSAAAGSRRCG
jgi:hypothetical protein